MAPQRPWANGTPCLRQALHGSGHRLGRDGPAERFERGGLAGPGLPSRGATACCAWLMSSTNGARTNVLGYHFGYQWVRRRACRPAEAHKHPGQIGWGGVDRTPGAQIKSPGQNSSIALHNMI